jgi:hypothetical protein
VIALRPLRTAVRFSRTVFRYFGTAVHGVAICGVTACVACEQGGDRPIFTEATGGHGGNLSSGGQAQGGAPPDRLGGSEDPDELSLPFAVDEHFVPFGYMGSPVTIFRDPNACKDRPEGAQGHCHAFRFLELSEQYWRGLYWLSEYDNWGAKPGRLIVPGATKITFFAATDVEDLKLFFFAGGVQSDGVQSDLPYKDAMQVEIEIAVSPELKKYSISLSGESYEGGVIGGFGWGVYTVKGGLLWIDDIRWE